MSKKVEYSWKPWKGRTYEEEFKVYNFSKEKDKELFTKCIIQNGFAFIEISEEESNSIINTLHIFEQLFYHSNNNNNNNNNNNISTFECQENIPYIGRAQTPNIKQSLWFYRTKDQKLYPKLKKASILDKEENIKVIVDCFNKQQYIAEECVHSILKFKCHSPEAHIECWNALFPCHVEQQKQQLLRSQQQKNGPIENTFNKIFNSWKYFMNSSSSSSSKTDANITTTTNINNNINTDTNTNTNTNTNTIIDTTNTTINTTITSSSSSSSSSILNNDQDMKENTKSELKSKIELDPKSELESSESSFKSDWIEQKTPIIQQEDKISHSHPNESKEDEMKIPTTTTPPIIATDVPNNVLKHIKSVHAPSRVYHNSRIKRRLSLSNLAAIHYFANSTSQVPCEEHMDYSLVSLISANDSGLQVRHTKAFEWVDCDKVLIHNGYVTEQQKHKVLIVLLGVTLAELLHGRMACFHQVIKSFSKDRISLPFFFYADPCGQIKPALIRNDSNMLLTKKDLKEKNIDEMISANMHASVNF